MQIDILTVVPESIQGFLTTSIPGRAMDKGIVSLQIHNLRDYAANAYRQVDDYPFGGGAGMVLMIEPIVKCIETLQQRHPYDELIYMCPDGEPLRQPVANHLSTKERILILCGHYKGVDERVREHFITREISIGDYVLSSGELAAAVLTDAIVRLIPGVISDEESALSDSFQDNLLAPPVYTRPADFRGWKVPEVLLSGHAARIEEWRMEQSELRTRSRRPDLPE